MKNADLHERIKQRAYLLWEQEGRPEGRADDHWFRAEAELARVDSGTPGAGERNCPACEGTGRVGRKRCTTCGGTGRVAELPEP